ncbi:putative peptidoglycan lipid II flippase [Herbihabitans rhizosphaerae]|uniref:Putative peptidoglycan lipid II flippase n=1 Tax=Herbihabitans rhizosphaerae TaxID=1872711 RepID=A0A4Q7KNS0_9PSEU|nr:murein biosynthesis integral membrane protein MurJ [Herbihabitans rhizosphaerae]RZS37620.1 putative peptidoglycan lipid II flippase [Herbihabitans rhizosphaerae]
MSDLDATMMMPRVQPEASPSLARSSSTLAIATLVSRITGFGWKIVLAWVVGLGQLNDSYTVASSFPTIINELLLGGVLSSVVVPLLVRAQKEDRDRGEAYTQRLLTIGCTILVVGTTLAMIFARELTNLYVSDEGTEANPELTEAFTYLILPAIVFMGLSAMVMAILNTKSRFAATGWAPVTNNLIMFAVIGLYAIMPGELTLNPVAMSDPKLLVLGIGFPLGIASQLFVLIPALRKTGFRFRVRFGWDRRLGEFGGLAAWVIAYALLGQLGVSAVTNTATNGAGGGAATYFNAWLLLQFPYGVIGVSLLTVIMPRMSRAAADGDFEKVKDDLSLGSRLSTVMLGPLCGLMTVLGPSIGIALVSFGKSDVDQATRLGLAVTSAAFGVLPFAICMLQMRVFYAMKDSRTPTLIMAVMMAVKVPLSYLCPQLLDANDLVYGLTFVNSLSFVVGAIVGELWLRSRLGRLGTSAVVRTVLKTFVASVWGAAAALAVVLWMDGNKTVGGAWLSLVLGTLAGGLVTFGIMTALRVRELDAATARITRLVRRR